MTDPRVSSPSWTLPIAVGATVTLAVLALQAGLGTHPAGFAVFCGAPVLLGIVPAWLAHRRDPSIGAGRGFAVSLIAVGIGALLWIAAGLALGMFSAIDVEAIRQAIIEQQQSLPAEERISDQELEEKVESAADMARTMMPYMMALLVITLSVGSAVVGLITGAILHRRPPQQ